MSIDVVGCTFPVQQGGIFIASCFDWWFARRLA